MTANAEAGGDRLVLSGRITAGNVLDIRRRGESWLASLATDSQASVDLSSVTAASSVLLSLLLCLQRRAGQRRILLALDNVPEDLLGLARLNGVSRWLTGHR